LPFDRHACDVVLLSMTLHHFDEAEQVVVLREAARVARRAVIVNELERCTPNYLGARLLAGTRWRGNRLTRHDGPMSVLRAFTMNELRDLAAAAGLHVHLLQRMLLLPDRAARGRQPVIVRGSDRLEMDVHGVLHVRRVAAGHHQRNGGAARHRRP
jgi:hypothetical protein